MGKTECFKHTRMLNPVTNREADNFQIQPGSLLGAFSTSCWAHQSASQECSVTPYPRDSISPQTFLCPQAAQFCPVLSSPPLLHALLSNNACPKKTTLQAGERLQQSSPAMHGIPAREPSREIHLCGPDSEELFGAKHCAIKWR